MNDNSVKNDQGALFVCGQVNSGKSGAILAGFVRELLDDLVLKFCTPDWHVPEGLANQLEYLLLEHDEDAVMAAIANGAYDTKDVMAASGALVKLGNSFQILGNIEGLPSAMNTLIAYLLGHDSSFADAVLQDAFPAGVPPFVNEAPQ